MIEKIFIMLLFVLFTTNGCTSTISLEPVVNPVVDENLQVYLDGFVSESKGLIKKEDVQRISLGFKKYKKNKDDDLYVVGTCYWYSGEITINEEWWKYAFPLERKEVVYHELGHCVLFREHTESTETKGFWAWIERVLFKIGILEQKGYFEDGCPMSMMHPRTIDSGCMTTHYVGYIDELYKNSGLYKVRNCD